jgi:uncharacterized protein
MSNEATLALFAKQPIPGRVKTRLASATSPEWAAALSEAFLLDALDRFESFEGRRVLVYDPPEAREYFQRTCTGRFELEAQTSGDLGQRLGSFLERELARSSGAVLVVGTDSPTLPTAFIAQAVAELKRADVVVGPTMDGGYYLIGCTRHLPDLFTDIPWSTNRVLSETTARTRAIGVRLALVPPWYDVDTLDDVRMLHGHLAALRLAGFDRLPQRTDELLRRSTW